MRKVFSFPFILIAVIIVSSSCNPSSRIQNMTYLADSVTNAEKVSSDSFKIVLQTGDRITILVTALNPLAADEFNILTSATTTAMGTDASKTSGNAPPPVMSDYGYLVDDKGNIHFPQLGTIHVGGLTTNEVADTIKNKLLQYLKDPTVIVNFINFRINVLGEVNHPGTITVPDGRITILEAISEASDLTVFGKRNNVLVVREKDGKREFGRVDLTSNQLFNSPFFYLKQGDVVYVELNKNKLILSDANAERNFRIITIILTAITAGAISYEAIKR